MITRRTALGVMAAALTPGVLRAAPVEPEFFSGKLAAGELPPLAERLPKRPLVVELAALGRTPGRSGGDVRTLIGSQKDIRLMTIYGYSRLVGFDEKLAFRPDILESYESDGDRVFTFHLREGHKWSDGSPLTTEDFRYTWEDVLAQRGPVVRRRAARHAGRRQAAQLRGGGPADRALQLGRAEPRLSAKPRGAAGARPGAASRIHAGSSTRSTRTRTSSRS